MNDRINEDLLRQILSGEAEAYPTCNVMPHDCKEKGRSWGLDGYPLAMVYAPNQSFDELYDLEAALSAGTVFKELDLPFKGMSVTKGGKCRD